MVNSQLPSISTVIIPFITGAELIKVDPSQWSSTLKGIQKYNPNDRVQMIYKVNIKDEVKGETLFEKVLKIGDNIKEYYQFEETDYPEEAFHANKYVEMFAGMYLNHNGIDGDIYPFNKDSLIIEGNSIFENPEEIKMAVLLEEKFEGILFNCPFIIKGEEACYILVMAKMNQDIYSE